MPVLFLNENDVSQVLTMEMAMEGVESALRKMAIEEAFNIPRSRCQTDHTVLHVLAAAAKSLGVIGYKSYTTNRRGTRFHVTIYDGKTGEMLSLMQADQLGRMRTGAASAIATKYLARENVKSLGVFGSGKQAKTQILGICKVRPIEQVTVYSPTPSNCQAFAQEMTSLIQLPVHAVSDPSLAAINQDIIATATTSRDPVLFGNWLSPGTHLNIIGSNFLAKREVDTETVKRCQRIAIDHEEQARIEAGDFVEPLREKIINWSDLAELGRIITGRTHGRKSPEDITMFKSLGIGLEDIAVAIRVFHAAKDKNIGQWIDL